jgi:nucleotide-binding universal stress UspA family protein
MGEIGSFKSLLVCSDGSESGEGAVREAIKLAKDRGAKLTALKVVEYNPELEAYAPDAIETLEAEARTHIDSVKARAESEGVSCEALVKRSVNPYEEIVEEARGLKADAIVMGRRGRTGIMRFLMGDVTAKVIGHSPTCVFVVPMEAELKFGKILVGTDGSKYSEDAALKAISLAKSAGGSIVAVSVADDDEKRAEDYAGSVKAAAEKEGLEAETVVKKGRPDDVIVNTAKEKGCDLIVVGSHGGTGLKRLLMGSVAERVIGHAEGAVLVVPAGE